MRHIQRSVSIALAALTLLLTANLATAQSIAQGKIVFAGTYGNERDGFGFSGALAAEW